MKCSKPRQLLGALSSVLLLLAGCGGNSGSSNQGGSAAPLRSMTLRLTRSAAAPGVAPKQGLASRQVRQIQPGEAGFIERLQIRVQLSPGVDLLPLQVFALDATEQETMTREVALPEQLPPEFRVRVSAFNNFNGRQTEIFVGEVAIQRGQQSATVTLLRNPDPSALVLIPATPANLQQTTFTFLDGAAFGLPGTPVTLAIGTFEGNAGDFTLASDAFIASGEVTLGSCTFAFLESTFPPARGPQVGDHLRMDPCQVDAVDGRLMTTNTALNATSTSGLVAPGPATGVLLVPTSPPLLVTAEDTPGTVSVGVTLVSDRPVGLTFRITRRPAQGTATVDGTGLVTYQPATDFNGSDRLVVTAIASFTDGRAPATLLGTVRVFITVQPVDDVAEPVGLPSQGVQGQVTASGTPVPGLPVHAYSFATGAFIAEAVTDAAGHYVLELPAGTYTLVALGTGQWATQWSGGAAFQSAAVPVTVASLSTANFSLVPGGALAGQVTDAGGMPVAGRSVDIFDANDQFVATAATDANGSFARGLAPGRYKVRVNGGRSGLATTYFAAAPVRNAATPVEVTSGTTTTGINVQLAPGGRILGRVIAAATGNPVNQAQVLVDDIPRGFLTATRTDSAGNYVLNLAPGNYRVRVRAPGTNLAPQFHHVVGSLMVSAASTPVTVMAGADTTNVDFHLSAGGTLTGRVVSAVDGTPLAGVTVTTSEFSNFGFVDNTSTRFDGTYVLNLPPGDYKVRAIATGTPFATLAFGGINQRDRSTSVRVDAGLTTPGIDLFLPIGGIIGGRVTTGGVGIPAVEVDFDDRAAGFIIGERSQFDGFYRVALLAPRDYHVSPFTGTTSFMNLAKDDRTARQVSLTPGMEVANIDFDLRPDAIIAGRVTDTQGTALPSALIGAFDATTGVFVASARTDFAGAYMVALPAGSYQVRVVPLGLPLPWQWFRSDGTPAYRRTDASTVSVGTGQTATADISVAAGGSIAGRLVSVSNGMPVSTAEVAIIGINTGAFAEVAVRADGTYTAYGPVDLYRVEVRPAADTALLRQFFPALVQITAIDQETPNIDFVLGFTRPMVADTDGDGFSDDIEEAVGSDPHNAASLPPLYDDFNAASIDPDRWQRQEVIRDIDAGQLVTRLAQFGNRVGSRVDNLLNVAFTAAPGQPVLSNMVTTFQADVTVTEVTNTNAVALATLRRVPYNDSEEINGRAGDIFLGIEIRHDGSDIFGFALVQRCTNSTCSASTTLASHRYNPVSLGTTHRLAIDFDGTRFTFGFDADRTFVFDPVSAGHPIVRLPQTPEHSLGLTIFGIGSPAEGASIAATFDNVAFNGAPFDDFSSPTLDRTRWRDLELVREIDDGQLASELTRFGSSGSNELRFFDPNSINAFQADVTVTEIRNTSALPMARLMGFFYNDGTPGGGSAGEILAEIGIRHNGTAFEVVLEIGRCGVDCSTSFTTILFDTATFGPVALGETHTLLLAWDGSTTFTFGFDNQRATFNPTGVAPVAMPARFPVKALATRVVGIGGPDAGGSIAARFDNVVVVGADSDGDGLNDALEVAFGTDRNSPDTDGDGLADGAEVFVFHTDPTLADTDDDGLSDGAEVTIHGTDPRNPDSDGDDFSDGEEVSASSDPLDPASVPTQCLMPSAGLISWWPGDEHTDDLVDDNIGTLMNGAGFTAGQVDGAFSFDGIDDFVQAPTTGLPTGNSDRTLELWARVDAFVASEAFFAGYGSFGSDTQTYHLGTSGSALFFSQWGSGLSGPSLQAGRWYHIAVTNVGNVVTLYLDGLPVNSGTLALDTPAGTQFTIGRIAGALGDSRRLQGAVDEITVYSRALSAAEIQAIFNARSAGKCKP